MNGNFMRIMREHEAFPANLGMNLFCGGSGLTKQILGGVFGDFCLILPHKPHVFSPVRQLEVKNMRIMREHEDSVFKGAHLFRIGMGVDPCRKYEAVMKIHEAYLHVLTPWEGREVL